MLKGNLRAQWIELSLQNKKKNDKELKKNDKTHLKDKTHLSQKKKKKKTTKKYPWQQRKERLMPKLTSINLRSLIFPHSSVHEFPRVAIRRHCRLGGLSNRNLASPSSGGSKS